MAEVIDLCLSDDDAGASVPRVSKSTEGAKVEGSKVENAPLAPRVRDDDDDDDEDCFAVAAPPARAAPPAAALGDDEDIVITSHSGALSDFPHSREHQRPVAPPRRELGAIGRSIEKFAPGLVVARFYGSDKLSPKKLADWRDVDVLVSTFTTKFKAPNVFGDLLVDSLRFHRIVVDEIHLTFQSADFRQLKADRKWAVTGTPMTTAVDHLSRSASFLGVHGQISGQMQAYRRAFETPGADCVLARKKQDAFDGLVAALKLRMIRHTKAMRLGGAVALALPDELAATVALDFSDRERAAYREDYDLGAHRRTRIRGGGATKFTVEMTLAKSRHACQRSKAKRAALLADLEARRGARGCRAVIFTEYKDVHAELVTDLRRTFPSFRVFEFSGGTDANVRHRSIREFQADEGPPDRIFVITMRAGSVGITLTAADVVYLLGPCVDPADEVQAAGRIHRLGQSSDVLIKKFVVNGTVEASICELHDKIKAGALALDSANVSPAAATLLCSK
ncbi:helicase [Aureococcus anophagefferens]|nr:helicase [Aureococcus anophagefferens]